MMPIENVWSGKMQKMREINRPAIAMIELIFAIVVMGITLLSAPMLLRTSIQSSNIGMQQESIAAAASEINLIMSRQWDERDTDAAGGAGILQTDSTFGPLGFVARTFNMQTYFFGSPGASPSRAYNSFAGFTQASDTAEFGPDANDGFPDDIDDFNGLPQKLNLYAGETASISDNEGEYIDKLITLNTVVSYGTFSLASSAWNWSTLFYDEPFANDTSVSSDVKLVRVTLSTDSDAEEMQKTISLSAFSCNIGSPGNDVVVY